MISLPEIVSAGKWQQDRDELLQAEKEATRALDVLAARRRRLPMVTGPTSTARAAPTSPATSPTWPRWPAAA
jgi:glycerol dehydrogenase-like iron-containing ADH family enzyme